MKGIYQRIESRTKELLTLTSKYNAKLIGVTKTVDTERIRIALEAGLKDVGESRVQELSSKVDFFNNYDINIHLIGHLQTNKAKKAVILSDYIHSIDSLKIAQKVSSYAQRENKIIKVLLEVKVSKDLSKYGYNPEVLKEEFPKIIELPNIEVIGLMTIATYTEDKNIIKEEFRSLRLLLEELKKAYSTPSYFKELSMGMSGDYRIALDEGSTMIRVGTYIFGDRKYV